MDITLSPALSDDDRQAVRNMFVAYFYDLAPYDPNLVINAFGLPCWEPALTQGSPGPRTAAECWEFNKWVRDSVDWYLIRVDGAPAGFVFVMDDNGNLPAGCQHELMDFYVTPKYRRHGIGSQAARLAFETRHGRWVLYQLSPNYAARKFWLKVLRDYTAGNFEMVEREYDVMQQFSN